MNNSVEDTTQAIGQLASALWAAKHPVVLTGAGVSAESGLATFRGPQDGLWAKYRPEDLATPEAFNADPETVWRWYEWRRAKLFKHVCDVRRLIQRQRIQIGVG